MSKQVKSVSLNGDYDAASNGMQNAFMNKLLFGGYIDTKMKDDALNKMHGYNQLGINLNYGIKSVFRKKA